MFQVPTISLVSHASKIMLKIPQAKFQWYMNWKLSDIQAGFWKGKGSENQTGNIRWIIEKVRELQKNIYFCFINYSEVSDSVDHNKLWKILKEMGVPDHFYVFWETHMWVKKQPLEPYMEQRNGS